MILASRSKTHESLEYQPENQELFFTPHDRVWARPVDRGYITYEQWRERIFCLEGRWHTVGNQKLGSPFTMAKIYEMYQFQGNLKSFVFSSFWRHLKNSTVALKYHKTPSWHS